MNSIFQITVLSIIFIITGFSRANAQLVKISLDEKIEKSSLIVEGRVVGQESYLTRDGEVYTANKVAVSSLLKGELKGGYVTVTTWGGTTTSQIVTWTHMLTLNTADKGIFFLEESQIEETTNRNFPSPAYEVYSSSQGFLKFVESDKGAWMAIDPFHVYRNPKDEAFEYIAQKTGKSLMVINGAESMSERTGIRYFFKTTSISGTTINFDIIVNSLYDSKSLYKAGAAVSYNTDCFGTNLATNGNLSLQTNGISSNTVYSMTKSNITSSKAKIELNTTGSVLNLSTLTDSEQTLAKASLTITNPFADPGISFDIAEMYSLSKYWEGGSAHEFDTVIVETDFNFGFFAPHIDSIFPNNSLRAGVGDVLTIYGSGFTDSQPTNGRVQFRSAFLGDIGTWIEPLPFDYLEWKENIIRVVVPSVGYFNFDNDASPENYAGTGKLRVKMGSQNSNQVDLYVRFCARNDTQVSSVTNKDYRIVEKLRNFNGTGGYDIYFTSEFSALAGAKDAFKRALGTWRCATRVNITANDNTSIPADAGRVFLGALPAGCPSSSKACTFLNITSGCQAVGTDSFVVLFYNRFDIYFKSGGGISWHTGTNKPVLNWSNQLDLETVALHEIGHAHLLQHTNNTDDVMYFQSSSYKRDVEGNDLEGGLYIMGISSTNDGCGSHMIPNTDSCGTTPIIEVYGQSDIMVYPNPFDDEVIISQEGAINSGQEYSFLLYNELGQQVKAVIKQSSPEIIIDTSLLDGGMYFLVVADKAGVIGSTKLFKLN
jgi:hypothetical protein